ncbi:MAG TPA: hypothetical protein VKZ60_08090 [Chloroflexota bacterium]|jgi:hypothetical protein|nr:hypothetical protein [Chloroflexota bacterium]
MSEANGGEGPAPDLATLLREIELVHAEVHALADRLDDLEAAWARLPAWVRWVARIPPPPARGG